MAGLPAVSAKHQCGGINEADTQMHELHAVEHSRAAPGRGLILTIGVLLFVGLADSQARSETPAPSVHWGTMAFPDQYSTLAAGLTLNRFTPTDGNGTRYDSTVPNTLGFNLITLSWTQHWEGRWEGWSTNLTLGVSPTGNEPTAYFQNEFVHRLRHIPPVPTVQPRRGTDVTADGSVTKWFPLIHPRTVFLGGGFSVGTLYQQGFLRAGIRRLQVTPTLYQGSWGAVSGRASVLGRVSYQEDGGVIRSIRQTSGLVQPALAFGQYAVNRKGETVPTWEIEFALMWDSGIFVNQVGESQKQFFWSAAVTGGPVRFETWNDSLGNISTRDFGPTYGASLTVDLFRVWSLAEGLES
jgi:hypothetical protein